MSEYKEAAEIDKLISAAKNIVILQADNPDGDSLASSLALEEILDKLGKNPYMYCGVDIPSYLHYLSGWDRVEKDIPKDFDLSIVVDCSSISLFETLNKASYASKVADKPCIVLDHHAVDLSIPFATVICNKSAVATGEVIYELAQSLKWDLSLQAKRMLSISILSDSLGLISEGTTPRSIHIIAELVDGGVKLAELEEARRDLMRKSPELLRYKGELLQRVQYFDNNKISIVTIPWSEIEKYSQAYNPSMLVIDDMRLTEGTDIAIAFKLYKDGKVTAKIRCNYGKSIANDLAKHFGGGGHPYASGFKVGTSSTRSFENIKSECISTASDLLNKLGK